MNFFDSSPKKNRQPTNRSDNEVKNDRKQPGTKSCGICGVGIWGRAFHRPDLDIYICDDCISSFQNVSAHERVKSCDSCGYSFLPGFSKWYYRSTQPKCPVCGSVILDVWSFQKLANLLDDPNLSEEKAAEVMTVVHYGGLGNDKCPKLELSEQQKTGLYLKAIKSPHFATSYDAYLALRRIESKSPEILDALGEYEKTL